MKKCIHPMSHPVKIYDTRIRYTQCVRTCPVDVFEMIPSSCFVGNMILPWKGQQYFPTSTTTIQKLQHTLRRLKRCEHNFGFHKETRTCQNPSLCAFKTFHLQYGTPSTPVYQQCFFIHFNDQTRTHYRGQSQLLEQNKRVKYQVNQNSTNTLIIGV